MNCGAIAKELFGGELFGHVPGAFTGASRDGRPGKFELADGGVLCLDEIGEMPLDIQPYLLRVLEDRIVHRIGDSKGRPVDVHLVALTNRDLKAEVEAGRFRRDLYYRIGTVTISVPPLRERGDDVALLVEHFNRQIATQTGAGAAASSPTAVMAALLAYRWPGNVRELEEPDRPPASAGPRSRSSGSPTCRPRSRGRARPAEAAAGSRVPSHQHRRGDPPGDRAGDRGGGRQHERVAHTLGISRPTLYRKLKLYGISGR